MERLQGPDRGGLFVWVQAAAISAGSAVAKASGSANNPASASDPRTVFDSRSFPCPARNAATTSDRLGPGGSPSLMRGGGGPEMVPSARIRLSYQSPSAARPGVPGFFGQEVGSGSGWAFFGLGHGGVVVPRQLALVVIGRVRVQDAADARLVELGGGDAEIALGLLELAFGRGRQALASCRS